MNELLTTRQVQNLLKVDRITVYRMLQDGRLKGVKIGQQWRFHQNEVERLLTGEDANLPSLNTNPAAQNRLPVTPPLPVHCLQAVLTLFSSVSQLGALVIDLTGEPVTVLSGQCALCRMMQDSPRGAQACRQSWQAVAAASAAGEREHVCHAGLTYLTAPIMDGETTAAWLLVGQIRLSQPDPEDISAQAQEMARNYALPLSAVQESIRKVSVIPSENHDQMHSWVIDAAKVMGSILQERAIFLQRMQQIADLTQIG